MARPDDPAVWDLGDYGPTSRQLAPASAHLVETLGVAAGHRVLDVAAGHGNCAIAAASRGATTTAADFAEGMIAAGAARTRRAGLDIGWVAADAAALPFAHDRFDVVTSVFGVIFTPAPERTADELLRVVRPGGQIGLTAWTLDGLARRLRDTADGGAPPRVDDTPDPMRWSDDGVLRRLFAAADDLHIRRRAVTLRYPSWQAWRSGTEAHGMSVAARRSMTPDAYRALLRRTEAATAAFNTGSDGRVVYEMGYVEIVVTKATGPRDRPSRPGRRPPRRGGAHGDAT